MSHDVFISYSSKDKPFGDAACAILERSGLRCWIAPRDICAGHTWGAAIVEAIAESKVFVLILSERSNESDQVLREVERAVNRGIPILPVRIENIMPSSKLEYFISACHWLDAITPPLEDHLHALARSVSRLINPPEKVPTRDSDLITPGTKKRFTSYRAISLAAAFLFLLVSVTAVAVLRGSSVPPVELIQPQDNATELGPVLRFEWGTPKGTTNDVSYELEIVDANNTTHVEKLIRSSFVTSAFRGPLKWRVRELQNKSTEPGAWSAERSLSYYPNSLERILQTKTVRIGIAGASEGDYFVSKAGDKLGGYEVELLLEILKSTLQSRGIEGEVTLNYSFVPWGEKFFRLIEDPSIDLLASGISIVPEREKKYGLLFSSPTLQFPQTLLSKKSVVPFKKHRLILNSIGVVPGTTNETLLKQLMGPDSDGKIRLYSVPNPYTVQLKDLIEDKLEGFLLDLPYAIRLSQQFSQDFSALQFTDITRDVFPQVTLDSIGFAGRRSEANGLIKEINEFLVARPERVQTIREKFLPAALSRSR